MISKNVKYISPSELNFDTSHPRLVEFDIAKGTPEEEIIEALWKAMYVEELLLSIAASGFFQHEPLIVEKTNDKHIVIEGNRRLAAVKILLNPAHYPFATKNLSSFHSNFEDTLKTLPVIIASRKEAWQYLGFKHISGPAKWSNYAKSRYIANVHRNFGVSLEEIAKHIGDTHRITQRLFRGLMVIEQAERMKVFDREDRWNRYFSIAYLYTGIGHPGISEFIGLKPENEEAEEPVPTEKRAELGELFLWLYGSKKQEIQPLIRSQNSDLSKLDRVLGNKEALATLRSRNNLDLAYEQCETPIYVFEKSLHDAKRALERAHSKLTTGYERSSELLAEASMVSDVAYDLYEEMHRKRHSKRRERMSEAAGLLFDRSQITDYSKKISNHVLSPIETRTSGAVEEEVSSIPN